MLCKRLDRALHLARQVAAGRTNGITIANRSEPRVPPGCIPARRVSHSAICCSKHRLRAPRLS